MYTDWPISRSNSYFLFEELINDLSHVELSFRSVEKMAASKTIFIDYKAITIVSTPFVSVKLITVQK